MLNLNTCVCIRYVLSVTYSATNKQLDVLSHAKSWYVDGTFKLCRHPFNQLLTVSAFVRADDHAKQVPLLFASPDAKRRPRARVLISTGISSLITRNACESNLTLSLFIYLYICINRGPHARGIGILALVNSLQQKLI